MSARRERPTSDRLSGDLPPEFVDGPAGRRAVVAGTGIDVWQVVDAWNAVERDDAATLTSFPSLTPMQIRSALA